MTTPPQTQLYAAEALIGAGDLGQVFRARRQSDGQTLALKVFHQRVAAQADFRRRLEQLAAAPPAPRQDGVVYVHERVAAAPRFYVAMDLHSEGSLRSLLQRRARAAEAWSLGRVLELARQAAGALAVLHEQGLAHRNVKPSNILLAPPADPAADPYAYHALLSDAGVFRLAEEVVDASSPLSYDTLAYASPEWFQGGEPDARSDIYGLGVLLYEIVTGYPPFEGRTFNDAWKVRDKYVLPSPAQLRPDLPGALHELVLACLARDPRQRPESAGEVAGALAALIPALPDQPAPPPAPTARDAERLLLIPRIYKLDDQQHDAEVFELSGDGLTVGSDPASSAIVLDSAQIAPQQLQIDWLGDAVEVTLLAERADALLEDRSLQPHSAQVWVPGTMLRLGPYYLRLDLPGPAPAGPEAAVAGADADLALVDGGPPVDIADLVFPEEGAPPAAPQGPSAPRASCAIVTPEPAELILTPGRVELFKVRLINVGEQTDHFELEVDGAPEAARCTLLPKQRPQLNKGDSQEVALSVDVPKTAASLAGDYPVTLLARSRRRENAAAGDATAIWRVLPFYADDLSLRRPEVHGRGLLRTICQLVLANDGNTPTTYQLRASDGDDMLSFSWREQGQVAEVEPGQRRGVRLALRPRRLHWYGRPIRRSFAVQATANGAELRREGSYEQRAVFPWWTPFLLLLLALLALWYLLTPRLEVLRRPGVRTPIPAGATVVVEWRAQNAPDVDLMVGSATAPVEVVGRTRRFSTTYISDTFRYAGPVTGTDRLWLRARSLLPLLQEQLPVDLTIVTPPPPSATPQPAQLVVVTQVIAVTQVPPPPTPLDSPMPTAAPLVQACRRGGTYAVSDRAPPGSVVLLSYNGREVDGALVGADGRYRLSFQVPPDEGGGLQPVEVRTADGEVLARLACFVTLPTSTPAAGASGGGGAPPLPTSPPPPPPQVATPLVRPAP